jgi:sugar/nucleoside kinase (ribokinase family)
MSPGVPNGGLPVIGIRGNQSWRRCQTNETSHNHAWVFLREPDARELAGQIIASSRTEDLECLAAALKKSLGIGRLIIHSGPRGAVLVNGLRRPLHVPTCPLECVDDVGAGDILLTVTVLSSAAGANDRISLERGVAAATGCVAGLDLPRMLEELDAE